jgi:hypothetical protein
MVAAFSAPDQGLTHFLSVLPDIVPASVHTQVCEHGKNATLLQRQVMGQKRGAQCQENRDTLYGKRRL